MYVWCSDNPTPPCDQMSGNLIISGGHVNMHIVQVITANGGRPGRRRPWTPQRGEEDDDDDEDDKGAGTPPSPDEIVVERRAAHERPRCC